MPYRSRHRRNRRRPRVPRWLRRYRNYLRSNDRVYGPRRNRRSRYDSESSEAEEEEVVLNDLHVKKVDMEIKDNTDKHHTEKYELDEKDDRLIVRRGQMFKITVTWNRKYNNEADEVTLEFYQGNKEVTLKVDESKSENQNKKQWYASLKSPRNERSEIEITPPFNCSIGDWKMRVRTKAQDKDEKDIVYKNPKIITILFNPWCKEDQCYYKNEKELDEYVLCDYGIIYRGSWNSMFADDWEFGQFEEGVLGICLDLVKIAFEGEMLSDAVKISRGIAKMINSNDDNGVLTGNWSGNYEDGVKPTLWSKGYEILQNWAKANNKPVKYGQCWVFSAVTTTVCRALGIPCRSVTNFVSAHDTDSNTVIDVIYGAEGEHKHSDSVWNYHVWNEVWLKRPELPEEYHGWQVIDATPQELSDFELSSGTQRVSTCGPCPVVAIKEGDVNVPYDAPFVFAEVNADKFIWLKLATRQQILMDIKTQSVGKKISTKKPLAYQRLDITSNYKYMEGSKEEHNAVVRARNYDYESERHYLPKKEVTVTLDEPGGPVMVGKDCKFIVNVKNNVEEEGTSEETKRVIKKVMVGIRSQTYDGDIAGSIKTDTFDGFTLKKGEVKTLTEKLEASEYEDHLTDDAMLSVVALVQYDTMVQLADEEIPRKWVGMSFDEETFRFLRPSVEIEMPEKLSFGEEVEIKLSVENPLHKSLTNCELQLNVSHMDTLHFSDISNVKPGQRWKTVVTVKPRRRYWNSVTAIFKCNELVDVRDTKWLQVE